MVRSKQGQDNVKRGTRQGQTDVNASLRRGQDHPSPHT